MQLGDGILRRTIRPPSRLGASISTAKPRSPAPPKSRSTIVQSPRESPPSRRRSSREVVLTPGRSSAVRRLADECFKTSNEAILAVLRTKPKASKWDLKEKVAGRDELIKCLRSTLADVRSERACFRDEVARLERSLQADISERAEAQASLTVKLSELKEELTTQQQSSTAHQSRAEELECRCAELEDSLGNLVPAKEELEKLQSAADLLEAQLTARTEELTELQRQRKIQEEVHVREMEELRDGVVKDYAARAETLSGELIALRAAHSEQSKTLLELESAHTAKMVELDDLEKKSSSEAQQVAHLQSMTQKLTSDLLEHKEHLKAKEQSLMTAISNLTQYQDSASKREDKLREEIQRKTESLAELSSENVGLLQEKTQLDAKNIASASELATLKSTVEELRSQLGKNQEDNAELRTKFATLNESVAVEQQLRRRAEEAEAREREERTAACAQLLAMQSQHRADLDKAKAEASKAKEEFDGRMEEISADISDKENLNRELENRIRAQETEAKSLREALADAEAQKNADAMAELATLKGEMELLRRQKADVEQMKSASADCARQKIQELEKDVQKGEAERRKLHNLIQELRGNVRVFARVRPFLPSDAPKGRSADEELTSCITPSTDASSVMIHTEDESKRGDAEHTFNFDRVFSPSLGQDEVFKEVSEFVQSALDGYHVCLFSYGQTGSGKTHTMLGSGAGPMRGIIPRAMEQVGSYKEHLETQGWTFNMEVTFVEIYNEVVRDLLRDDDAEDEENKPEIRRRGEEVYLNNVNRVSVDPRDRGQFDELLACASRHRSVSSTNMNAKSSRSHSIFTLHLRGRHTEQKASMHGALNLVDLAGSERLSRSGATGDRLKEAQNINRSLSCLSDVFNALRNKAGHVPYRNSKLTQLLQPALSGDGKTLMIVNLSPTCESYGESLCSLRFAASVNQCELGRPKRQLRSISSGMDAENVAPNANRKPRRPRNP